MPTADDLVRLLGLRSHPEGGFYVETYRAAEQVGPRSLAMAIYYLLVPETFTRPDRS